MNQNNKMKIYNLILLKEQKSIGKVLVTDEFKLIEIKLNFTKQGKYRPVLVRLISLIRTSNNYKFASRNLKLSGVPAAFWLVLTQKLMSRLGILVDEEKIKQPLS